LRPITYRPVARRRKLIMSSAVAAMSDAVAALVVLIFNG